ncbi:MAG: ADP-ribosylglycohydrolase family protein [Polyangiales bacterium]|nr:ADP-ribosylglycohydrolase family protein [Myxococcales bacterium]MCB9661948.1 ADP-ribosylglycohydrolase family protein [Sandaracinaceae bacterium]
MTAPLERALVALAGLSVGDAFGERFFMPHDALQRAIDERTLPPAPWRYTDDTETALSVVDVLRDFGSVDGDALARRLLSRYDPMRAYGPGAKRLFERLRAGDDWREAGRALFRGVGSFGNGAAMRVPPLGAYFAGDDARCRHEAEQSALVTHAHPEGRAGAIAVAAAASFMTQTRGEAFDPRAFMAHVLSHTPASIVRDGIEEARQTLGERSVTLAAQRLGNGSGVTAADTVPLCTWLVCQHPDDFLEAMWATVSALGDRDTTCAIVGGVLACRVGQGGIPAFMRNAREPLPHGFEPAADL